MSPELLPLPQHQNPIDPPRTSRAPYNFVPLPEVVVTAVDAAADLPDHDGSYQDARYPYTGYFAVTLTTKTPLYVRAGLSTRRPDANTPSEFERAEAEKQGTVPGSFREAIKNKPDFFFTTDPSQPVIPGSSLRGMLRTLLEIVSYGKFTKVTDKHLIYRAVGDAIDVQKKIRGLGGTDPP